MMQDFSDHLAASCVFDDPRLSSTTAIHLLHAWGLALQSYKSMDRETQCLLFIEGINFMLPTVPVQSESTSSGREVWSGSAGI